jgi:hypothetical protein
MYVSLDKVGSVRFVYGRGVHDLAVRVGGVGASDEQLFGSGLHLVVQKADPSTPGGDLVLRFTTRRGDDPAWGALAAALEDALRRLKAKGIDDHGIDIRLPQRACGDGFPDPGTDGRSPGGGGGPDVV